MQILIVILTFSHFNLSEIRYGAGVRAGYIKSINSEQGSIFTGFTARISKIPFGFEGSFDYHFPEAFSWQTAIPEKPLESLAISGWRLTMAPLLYIPLSKNFTSYFTLGPGVSYLKNNHPYNPDYIRMKMVGVIGFGLEFLIKERISAILDFRQVLPYPLNHHHWNDPGDEEFFPSSINLGLGVIFYTY